LPEFTDTPLTITDFVRYQGASGDFNPMHHDVHLAQQAGLDDVFAPGMLAAGILGGYLADLYGPHAIRRLHVQFLEQAWPGDILTYGGCVRDRTGTPAELDLLVRKQSGGVHVRARATVLLSGTERYARAHQQAGQPVTPVRLHAPVADS
jgi:acyl dehydratase